jgi:hypothetical protein
VTDDVGVAQTNVPGLAVLYERDGETVTLHTVQMKEITSKPAAVFTLPPGCRARER